MGRGGWAHGLTRLMAILSLASIGFDLATDAGCDPMTLGKGGPASQSAADSPAAADVCTGVCVPDCFCCSASQVSHPQSFLPEWGLATSAPPFSVGDAPKGIRPVQYRPPRTVPE